MSRTRTFLFLQSHPSGFNKAVVKHLRQQGHSCCVINFSLGDWLRNLGAGASNYLGKVRNWRSYVTDYIEKNDVTDIVYYADQRPYHRIARAVARDQGLSVYAYEFGYLRPDWITLEKGGMGVFSHFPNDPDQIKKLAATFDWQEPEGHYPYSFLAEATHEVIYHLTPAFFPFLFPHYRHDRYYHPFVDYLSFLPRLFLSRANNKKADLIIRNHIQQDGDFFVVALQLQSDYQIRRASQYVHLSEMIDEILISFKSHAKPTDRLLFKLHPLDNNFERWPRFIEQRSREHGCRERVSTIDGGNLARILNHCRGAVVINSTVGLTALLKGVAVKPLGIAIYDVPEICFQESLDDFWTKCEPPNKETLAAFVKLLKAAIQVKGNFFTKQGRAVAIPEFARRIVDGDVNTHGAFVDPPPRLKKANELGVPMYYQQD